MTDANKTQAMGSDPNRTRMGVAPSVDPNRTMMGSAPTLNATITIKPVQCPICKTFNPVGVMFCVDCGLIFDRALPEDAFGAPAVQLPCLVDPAGREHALRPGENVVGRQGDVLVDDSRVSRRHACLKLDGPVIHLWDLDSTNGTKRNGEPVGSNPVTVQAGDRLSFGGYEMVVSVPGESAKTAIGVGGRTAAMSAPPSVSPVVAVLVGSGSEYPLKAGANTFGRKAENDVAIADPYVSGRHGVIEVADDGVYLTDVGSTNGTMLNDAKLTPHQRVSIGEEDTIRLGGLEFKVRLHRPT